MTKHQKPEVYYSEIATYTKDEFDKLMDFASKNTIEGFTIFRGSPHGKTLGNKQWEQKHLDHWFGGVNDKTND